jgi:hypothetical protein
VLAALRAARRVLAIGIGGGGDVVGALAIAEAAAALGTPSLVGGLTWERLPVDPEPGPRGLDEVEGVERLNEHVALAGPDARGRSGFRFAEGRVAELRGEPTLLVDPGGGPAALGVDLAEAAAHQGCDLVVLLDVGGDALAHGDEAGLGSPLADAVCLAAAPHVAAAGVTVVGAVFGAGCDGELTPEEVLARLAEVTAAGGGRGALGLEPAAVDVLAAAVGAVPTEASAMAVRCARGELGTATIRNGRRSVSLSPVGGLVLGFDPAVALGSAARCAAAVAPARSLEEANDLLAARGVRTELDYEREVTAAAPSPPTR